MEISQPVQVLQEVEAIRNNLRQNKEELRDMIQHIGGDNTCVRLDTNADVLLNRERIEWTSQQNYMTSPEFNSVKSTQTFDPYYYTTLNKDVGRKQGRLMKSHCFLGFLGHTNHYSLKIHNYWQIQGVSRRIIRVICHMKPA